MARHPVGARTDARRDDRAQPALEARAQPILAARSEAVAALATVDAWAAAVARPDALQLLQHLAGRLPGDGSRIRNLEWEGPRLRLVLAVPAATPRIAYVRALEGGGWLRNVREETQEAAAGTVALAAEIRGPAPAGAAAAAAAPAPARAAAAAAPAPGMAAASVASR